MLTRFLQWLDECRVKRREACIDKCKVLLDKDEARFVSSVEQSKSISARLDEHEERLDKHDARFAQQKLINAKFTGC